MGPGNWLKRLGSLWRFTDTVRAASPNVLIRNWPGRFLFPDNPPHLVVGLPFAVAPYRTVWSPSAARTA